MKPQFILAAHKQLVADLSLTSGLTPLGIADLAAAGQKHLTIRQREHLENDATYRQIIPYIMVSVKGEDGIVRFAPYVRTAAGGESKLHNNVSIGFGGHIDLADVAHIESTIDLVETVAQAAMRELAEELRFVRLGDGETWEMPVGDIGVLIDDSNEVGKVHMGVVLTCIVPHQVGVESNEDAIEVLPLMTASQLLESGLPLENWTRIVLEHFVSLGKLEVGA